MDEETSGCSTLQKRRSFKPLDYQFGYFRLPRGLSRRTRHYRSMAWARHGMRELTRGMAWERHPMCESALKTVIRGGLGHVYTSRPLPNGSWPDGWGVQLGTLIISPVLTGRSNDQERCDQAVVHAQWSVMDRNSIIALLYRHRKLRRNRLHRVHPIINKR